MSGIHPTAIVDPQAQLAEGVTIGAYSIIKGPVKIGAGTVVHEHTHLQGRTSIGRDCWIGPAAFVGLPPQHLRADLEIGQLIVGDHVIIRETTTIHRATAAGEDHATRIGDHCFIMGGVHIGHDCVLDEHVVAANGVLLGGHCHIGARAFLGGGAAMHQFVRVGRLAILSGNEVATQDIPPFGAFKYGGLKGYNAIGCKRAGMSPAATRALRTAYRLLHANRTVPAALVAMSALVDVPEVAELIAFLRSTKRGIVPSLVARPRPGPAEQTAASESE